MMLSFSRCLAAMAAAVVALFCSSSSPQVSAFTVIPSQQLSAAARSSSIGATKKTASTILYSSSESSSSSSSSRRSFLSKIIATSSSATLLITSSPTTAHAASSTKEQLLTDLSTSLTKISSIPPLLEQSEWDKVRTILKTPPVNQLWNLGESQNTLVKLAKETGNFDLMEVKDELAISLQMTDQYSYDNVFIYYQPGE